MTETFTKSGHAVLNTDSQGRESYLRQRRLMESKDAELNDLRSQINTMSNELSEIKSLLVQIAQSATKSPEK